MPDVNILAVIAVVVLTQVVGFLWYSVLFGKAWAPGYRLDADALAKTAPAAYEVTLVGSVIFTYAIALAVGLVGVSALGGGVLLGLGVWLGIIVPRYLLHALFARVGAPAIAIDLGFDLVAAVLAGAVLGAWQP